MTVSNHHRLCNRTIFSVKVQNTTYIISHQSFSYRFPFIFDNSSFSTVIFIVAVCTPNLPLGFQNSIRHFEGKNKMSICCSHHFNGSLLTNHQNVFWTLTRLTTLFRLILLSLYKAHYRRKTRSSLSRTRDNSFRTRITFIKTNLGEIDKSRF